MIDRTKHPAPNWLVAIWFTLIGGIWVLASSSDYQESRKMECAARSTAKHIVEWDSKTDTCKKERRNGTAKENR